MNSYARSAIVVLASAIVGFVATVGTSANAAHRQISSAACQPFGSSTAGFGGANYTYGYVSGGTVACPVIDDDLLPKTVSPYTLDVHISAAAAGTNSFGMACVWYANGAGGACNSAGYANSSGWNIVSIGNSTWRDHPYDFAYVLGRANNASFAGYYFEDQ